MESGFKSQVGPHSSVIDDKRLFRNLPLEGEKSCVSKLEGVQFPATGDWRPETKLKDRTKSKTYSYFKVSAGFVNAARRVCDGTVMNAISKTKKPDAANTHTPIVVW